MTRRSDFPKPWLDDKREFSASDLNAILSDSNGMLLLPSRPMDEVYPGIYIGDKASALNILALQKLGITHILNAAMGRNNYQCNTGPSEYKKVGIRYYDIPADDIPTFNLLPYFKPCANFIQSALSRGGKILVHCVAGASRSAAIAIAFLMLKRNMSVVEATRVIRAKREISPNDGFLVQLCELQQKLDSSKDSKEKHHMCILS